MNECYGKNFILNGDLKLANEFDDYFIYEGDSVYEVIRLIDGTPLFFRDHIDRLAESLRLQGKELLADAGTLRMAIQHLTRADDKKETNLKIVFNYNEGSLHYLLYFIEPHYPSTEQLKVGVKGILFPAERKNPGSKLMDHNLRSEINKRLILETAYEALLVNNVNMITEGSRSNIFFLKEDRLVTAPDSMILNGITRRHILDICRKNNIQVELKCVNVSDISQYDSVFMTGTSPMVLPFNCIGDKLFNSDHPLIENLRSLYLLEAKESIRLYNDE